MVNTGRPSRACGACRERRVKCDETRPVCRKCIRTGRECPGYMTGFKLRDQTQETILKATMKRGRRGIPGASLMQQQQQHQGNKKKSPTTTTMMMTKTTSRKSESPSRVALSSLGFEEEEDEVAVHGLDWRTVTTPLAEQARCYFLSSQFHLCQCSLHLTTTISTHHYLLSDYVVSHPQSAAREGGFLFVPDLLLLNVSDSSSPSSSSPPHGYQHFDDLFTAAAIATFSMRPNSAHARSFARLYYARGVSELRKTLAAGRDAAKSDYALASTILLGFYDVSKKEKKMSLDVSN